MSTLTDLTGQKNNIKMIMIIIMAMAMVMIMIIKQSFKEEAPVT